MVEFFCYRRTPDLGDRTFQNSRVSAQETLSSASAISRCLKAKRGFGKKRLNAVQRQKLIRQISCHQTKLASLYSFLLHFLPYSTCSTPSTPRWVVELRRISPLLMSISINADAALIVHVTFHQLVVTSSFSCCLQCQSYLAVVSVTRLCPVVLKLACL